MFVALMFLVQIYKFFVISVGVRAVFNVGV